MIAQHRLSPVRQARLFPGTCELKLQTVLATTGAGWPISYETDLSRRRGSLVRAIALRWMTLPLASVVVAIALFSFSTSGASDGATMSTTGLAPIDPSRPVLVVVRGWLWDPSSRRNSPELTQFPMKLRSRMLETSGVEPQVIQYQWSRIPKDLPMESDNFTDWAQSLTGSLPRGCVSFMGHSAGAAMIFRAAAKGVPMGYMGTLGLPTVGAGKPRSVTTWANFYTDTHIDDIAGALWAKNMKADINQNLEMNHSEFWESDPAVEITAQGISRIWDACRSG